MDDHHQQGRQAVLIVERNAVGRDFAIGDIHGEFDKVEALMTQVSFDPTKDRMFSVGDLVDRGPQSKDTLDWLKQPWFFAVRGNHEQMVIDSFISADKDFFEPEQRAQTVQIKGSHIINGGEWFYELRKDRQREFAEAFMKLPFVIEVPVGDKTYGIVHAEPLDTWQQTKIGASSDSEYIHNVLMWARDRIRSQDPDDVQGIDAVFVGHTPTREVTQKGNVFYIDQGACFGRHMTMVELNTLKVYQT